MLEIHQRTLSNGGSLAGIDLTGEFSPIPESKSTGIWLLWGTATLLVVRAPILATCSGVSIDSPSAGVQARTKLLSGWIGASSNVHGRKL